MDIIILLEAAIDFCGMHTNRFLNGILEISL